MLRNWNTIPAKPHWCWKDWRIASRGWCLHIPGWWLLLLQCDDLNSSSSLIPRSCHEDYYPTRHCISVQLNKQHFVFSSLNLWLGNSFRVPFLQCAGVPSHLILSAGFPRLWLGTSSPVLKGEQILLKTWMWTKNHSSGELIPVFFMHRLSLFCNLLSLWSKNAPLKPTALLAE